MDIPEKHHGRNFRTGLCQETVQVVVESNTDAVFEDCACQDPIVGRGAKAGISDVNNIESILAEQGCELGRKVLVKKPPKH